jgi:hypothetical protein
MDETTVGHALLLLTVSPPLLLAYLSHRRNQAQSLQVWHALLSGIAENPDKVEPTIKLLLDATQRGVLPSHLKPNAGELDALVENLLEDALAGDAGRLAFVKQVLDVPGNSSPGFIFRLY